MEEDGSYFVWVPRYAYKITPTSTEESSTNAGTIDVKFIDGIGNTAYDGTVCTIATSNSDKTPNNIDSTTQYIVHPAFCEDVNMGGYGTNLEGIWVAKYESSREDSIDGTSWTTKKTTERSEGNNLTTKAGNTNATKIRVVSKPNVTSWRYIDIGKCYTNAYNYNRSIDSHLMKNSEWGAVAYLTHSQYGRNGNEIATNNSTGYYTGRSVGKATTYKTSKEGTYKYNEKKTEVTIKEGTGREVSTSVTNDATNAWTQTEGVWASNIKGQDNGSTKLKVGFSLGEKGIIEFEYSVSSEGRYDILSYTIQKEGTTVVVGDEISGTNRGNIENGLTYEKKTHILEAGNYELIFNYKKDGGGDRGDDAGYVRNIKAIEGVEINVEILGEAGGLASTSGNIYGIYDMSGGASEFVSAWDTESTDSSVSSYGGSFASQKGESTKYATAYHNGTSSDYPTIKRCILGDATYEVNVNPGSSCYAWFKDNSRCAYSSRPFFDRGDYHYSNTSAGVFYSVGYDGNGYIYYSFRVVVPGS